MSSSLSPITPIVSTGNNPSSSTSNIKINKKSRFNKKTATTIEEQIYTKPNITCGCMATYHKFYSNCTSCGRIVCERQGKGICIICGSIILPPMSLDNAIQANYDENTIRAYAQKVTINIFIYV